MKMVYMCRTRGGGGEGCLWSCPSPKMGGFQSGHSRKKQGILEIKITKKRFFCLFFKRGSFRSAQVGKSGTKNCIFLKRGSFGAAHAEKVESLGAAKAEKMGGGGLSRGTYPYCPYMGVPPSPPPQVPTYRPSMNILNKQQTNIFLSLAIRGG